MTEIHPIGFPLRHLLATALLGAVLLLAACGGASSDDPSADEAEPTTTPSTVAPSTVVPTTAAPITTVAPPTTAPPKTTAVATAAPPTTAAPVNESVDPLVAEARTVVRADAPEIEALVDTQSDTVISNTGEVLCGTILSIATNAVELSAGLDAVYEDLLNDPTFASVWLERDDYRTFAVAVMTVYCPADLERVLTAG